MDKIKTVYQDILIAEGIHIFSESLGSALRRIPGVIVRRSNHGLELFRLIQERKPNVLIIDLQIQSSNGKDLFMTIRREHPEIKILILSNFCNNLLIEDYHKAGAIGFLSKSEIRLQVLVDTIKRINGEYCSFFTPNKFAILNMSPVQRKVLFFLLRGMITKEIAAELNISDRAIDKHRSAIYKNLGCNRVGEFYVKAMEHGCHYLLDDYFQT